MGSHEKSRRKRERTLLKTLKEAEHDHYLDCPNAPIFSRASALFLDVILWLLIVTGIHYFLETSRQLAPYFLGPSPTVDEIAYWNTAIFYSSVALKSFVTFCYFVWLVTLLGGSPAKILLGLRVLNKRTGQKLSLLRTIFRESLKIPVLAGGFVLYFFGNEFLHDRMAGSTVKKVHVTP